MNKKIVVDVHHGQIRVALLEGNELVELYMEGEESKRVVGNIYRGKVANVLPGMQAAFVDIGLDKNAFLYVGDINTDKSIFEFENNHGELNHNNKVVSIRDIIKEGQEITVQVLKEPIGTKGARVTTHITLPGRYLVLMPTVNYVGVSRRIEDESERQRLKQLAERIKPSDMGLIVRTAARGRTYEDFIPDMEFLCRLWAKIQQKEWRGKVPRLLYQDEDLIYRTIRDLYTPDIDKFVINSKEEYKKVLEFIEVISPNLRDRIELFESQGSIFEYFGIESEIEKVIQKKVWLKNGGYIVIDTTEALTVIDVNTGKFVGSKNLEDTVLKTNLEAAEEIAHQIRLRDIGGIIVIDFIDMEKEEHKQMVLDVLKQAFKKDRTKTNIIGFTGLGLVEMTRKKVRQRLASKLLKPCPYCQGTGRVYSETMVMAKVEKDLERIFNGSKIWGALVEVHPNVARLWTEDEGKALDMLEKTLEGKIFIKSRPNFHIEETNIIPINGQEELERILLNFNDRE